MNSINKLDENRSSMIRRLLFTSTYNESYEIGICFLRAAYAVKERAGSIDRDQFKRDVMRAIDVFIDTNLITHEI